MSFESLIEYLHNDNVRRFAYKTKFFQGKNTEFASDFDVFSAICDSISLFVCHPVREKLFLAVQNCTVDKIEPALFYDYKYRKYLWQRIFYENQENCLENCEYINPLKIDVSDRIIFEKSVELSDLVDVNCDTIFDVLNNALKIIKTENIKISTLNARKFKYSRTDDFHASKSYKQFVEGKDGDAFLLWLLCRILMNSDIKLRLTVNSASEAEKILTLLSTVKLSPFIYISFDIFAKNEYQKFIDIVLENYKKNISLEIRFSKEIDESTLIATIKELFCVIPFACIKISRDNLDTFCNALNMILSECLDDDERMLLLNSLHTVK